MLPTIDASIWPFCYHEIDYSRPFPANIWIQAESASIAIFHKWHVQLWDLDYIQANSNSLSLFEDSHIPRHLKNIFLLLINANRLCLHVGLEFWTIFSFTCSESTSLLPANFAAVCKQGLITVFIFRPYQFHTHIPTLLKSILYSNWIFHI